MSCALVLHATTPLDTKDASVSWNAPHRLTGSGDNYSTFASWPWHFALSTWKRRSCSRGFEVMEDGLKAYDSP